MNSEFIVICDRCKLKRGYNRTTVCEEFVEEHVGHNFTGLRIMPATFPCPTREKRYRGVGLHEMLRDRDAIANAFEMQAGLPPEEAEAAAAEFLAGRQRLLDDQSNIARCGCGAEATVIEFMGTKRGICYCATCAPKGKAT